MKKLNIKCIDRMTLVFLYSIFFMITCLILRILSDYMELAEDTLPIVYIIVGILFLSWLVIRFTKLSIEKVEKLEYRAVTILTSKAATIVIVIIMVLAGLLMLLFLLVSNLSFYIVTIYYIFIIIIPIIIIILNNFINTKYLLIINIGAVWLFTSAIIMLYKDDIISGVIYGSFNTIPYYCTIVVPLILVCILFYINCKLIFSAEKTYGVASFQRLLGIIGLFLVVLVLFLTFVVLFILSFFESLRIYFSILIFFPAVVVPYYVYYLVTQILYGKYRKEQEKIAVKQL